MTAIIDWPMQDRARTSRPLLNWTESFLIAEWQMLTDKHLNLHALRSVQRTYSMSAWSENV